MKMHTVQAGIMGALLIAQPAHAKEWVVVQKGRAFLLEGKRVESMKIAVGDRIRFLNQDALYHSIYSTSGIATFDLGVFHKGEARERVFDKAGTVEIECSIHPAMHLRVEVE